MIDLAAPVSAMPVLLHDGLGAESLLPIRALHTASAGLEAQTRLEKEAADPQQPCRGIAPDSGVPLAVAVAVYVDVGSWPSYETGLLLHLILQGIVREDMM